VSDVWAGATTIMKDYGSKIKMTVMTRMAHQLIVFYFFRMRTGVIV